MVGNKIWRMRTLIKITVATVCLVLAFQACHKEPETGKVPSIAGRWQCFVCVNPDQSWTFNDSTEIAEQAYSAAGGAVFTNRYHYTQVEDTVRFFHLGNYTIMTWAVRFDSDSVLNVKQIGAAMQPIQYLKRKAW